MDRVILHSDMNSCYASIELLYHPELRGKPLAVGGDPEARHGIVLAKSIEAKKAGVQTGMALWQARQACPEITFIHPNYERYMRFSRLAHEIYADYTDKQEPFGIDECWMDVTESCSVLGDGPSIAREINKRVKEELGVTVSVGVSWNKIYAKLGSDYKKPDAVTVFDRQNYQDLIYPLPASDLLYVGRATERKLYRFGITTIGQLADADPELLQTIFGKVGLMLSVFARGEDQTPVSMEHSQIPIKSVGNGMTTPRDLVCDEDVRIVLWLLAESVGTRLREQHFAGRVVEIDVRGSDLCGFTRQHKIASPTNITEEIAGHAIQTFREHYRWEQPIRSIGIRVSDLVEEDTPYQINLFESPQVREKRLRADQAIDGIRQRFGYYSVQRGLMLRDRKLSAVDAKTDNIIHPHSYLERGNRTGV